MEKKEKNKITFREMIDNIDSPFKEHLLMDLLKALLILVGGIILSILLKQLALVFISLLCFVMLAGLTYYKVLSCTEGLCHVYEGECLGVKYGAQPSCVIKLETGECLEIYGNIKKAKITSGDRIKAYIPYKSITTVIPGSAYKTYSCYGIYVIAKSYSEYNYVEPEKKYIFGFKKRR